MMSVGELRERVWLDKPKYDAAERKFYESQAKSSVGGKVPETSVEEVEIPQPELQTLNQAEDLPSPKPESKKANKNSKAKDKSSPQKSANDNVCPKAQQSMKPDAVVCPKKNQENICAKPAVEKVCSKATEPNTSPAPVPFEGKDSTHSRPKEEISTKAEKTKKTASPKKETINPIVAVQETISKSKSHNKSKTQEKISDEKPVSAEIDQKNGNFAAEIREVAKLKGYLYRPKAPFPSQMCQNKGTNVNNIPEISQLTPCPEKCPNLRKVDPTNQIPVAVAPLLKNNSVEFILPPIPPENINEVYIDDPAKKDSKKKKRNKKDRHRDKKGVGVSENSKSWNSLAGEVAKARQHIKNSLQCIDDIAVTSNTVSVEVTNRLNSLEKENSDLKNQVSELTQLLKKMELRVSTVEKKCTTGVLGVGVSVAPAPAPAAARPPRQQDDDQDDGVDLFGSDSEEEDAQAASIKEQRLAEYAARKSKKPVLIAKSNIIFDVKPWDDETDMKLLETEVRKIKCDGLIWGASKLVPLAYGIHKLQISSVVEDDLVSVDWLQETIQEIDDFVQSVDIAAFNKV